MKRLIIFLIVIGFIIPGNILEGCPAITGWKINPDPPFVNEDVKVSCTIEPQSDQTITSWEMTIREDGVIKGTPNTGSGGAQGQEVVASSNTIQFENPGQKNAKVTGKYLEKDDPDFSGDKDFNVYGVKIPTTSITIAMNIDTSPSMPNPTFHADIVPINAEVNAAKFTFKWYLEDKFIRDPNSQTISHRIPENNTVDISGSLNNGDWTPDWQGLLAGGNVKVYVVAKKNDDLREIKDEKEGYEINGTNPTQALIFSIASFIEAKAVCWKESGHCQFNATRYTGIGMPLPCYAHDGGYGLMQSTPASESEI
ncbi:MAG: hypothetical protein ABH873_01700 [Candidatus Firestonebacteria bacterium]